MASSSHHKCLFFVIFDGLEDSSMSCHFQLKVVFPDDATDIITEASQSLFCIICAIYGTIIKQAIINKVGK